MTEPPPYLAYKFYAHRFIPVGTRVKVLPGWEKIWPWICVMDEIIGCIGRVNCFNSSIDNGRLVRVEFENNGWWFQNASLEVLRD